MKQPTSKLGLYSLVLIFFCALSACKNDTSPPPPPPPVAPAPPPAPKPPAAPNTELVNTTTDKEVPPPTVEKMFQGQSTYYNDSYHGKKTKTEELYDKNAYTCAIRLNAMPLPMGSIVEVYSIKRKKKVQVRVNDIMSNNATAIIDLSRKAAEDIDLLIDGRTKVTVKVISEPK